MGLKTLARGRGGASPTVARDRLQSRYTAYYPRLFAYLHSCLGNDPAAAKELAVEAFAQAFQRCPNSAEESFRDCLFAAAHRLCRRRMKSPSPGDPLSPREREILSLAFDAQLSRREIAHLLRLKERTVTAAILRGLRKLRDQTSPAVLAAYLRVS